MLAKLDALIEKDGPAAKAAGAVATALYALLGAGVVPGAHWEAVLTAAVLLTLFAPAALRRDLNAKRAELQEGDGDAS
ncbi:MAG: hypothetical protein KAI80_05915 [Hyphomicrobiaceae bacterium]|nr:hypothetical protein [Hyphomicrobiaceae bacterium]